MLSYLLFLNFFLEKAMSFWEQGCFLEVDFF
jgi:hypothetical protein